MGLGQKTQHLQPLLLPPMGQGREVDVGGEVLLSHPGIEILTDLMPVVGQEGSPAAIVLVELMAGKAVINGDDKSPAEPGSNTSQPV